jgi:hypothetical protein
MTEKQTAKITYDDKLRAVKVLAQLERIGVLPGAGEIVGNVWTELETTKGPVAEPGDLQITEGVVSQPAKLVTDNCETCMYYVQRQSLTQPVGRCRRNAPTMEGFPIVCPADWCGEHTLDPEFPY